MRFVVVILHISMVFQRLSTNVVVMLLSRYDPQTNQWSSDVAPTTSCRTSVGVAVLDNHLYAVGGQDGVSCLNFVERYYRVLFNGCAIMFE